VIRGGLPPYCAPMATPLDPELVDQIRASLYEGRGVRLFGDDAPTTMLEPSTEMTPEGEAFFLGKLEKVAELLDQGFVVNIDSQGSILAVTPDRQSRYISTQETEIDVMDRIMVKNAIEAGAKVSFEQDGSLVIDGHSSPTPPSAEHAAAQYAEFERLADSGDINAELAAGRGFVFDAASVADPTPPPAADDPFDTAAELEAEAASLQMGVDVARGLSLPEFSEDKTAAEIERVAAEGRLAMAKAEEESALQQASSSGAAAVSKREAAADQRALAQEFRDAGDEARAEAHDADAVNLEAVADVHRAVESAALVAADAAAARIAAETEAVDAATIASDAVNTRFSELEEVLDQQEEQVAKAREAAAELAEAERLEAELPDLEARGVEGVERVREAIAAHRAAAEAHVEAGQLRGDGTAPIVIVGDEIDPAAVVEIEGSASQPAPDDLDLIEIEIEAPSAPVSTEQTESTEQPEASQPIEPIEVTEQTDAVWDGIDPALIEIDEPPAQDFGSDDFGSDGFGSDTIDGEMMDTDHNSITE
jgi:hypothetical protein